MQLEIETGGRRKAKALRLLREECFGVMKKVKIRQFQDYVGKKQVLRKSVRNRSRLSKWKMGLDEGRC